MADGIDGKGGTFTPVQFPLREAARSLSGLHPAWAAFITYCSRLDHGEIDRLTIQNGLPVLAEQIRKKVKFMR